MKDFARKTLLAFLLALVGSLFLAGCASTPQDSSVPWGRPQEWEGQLPGMGAGMP